MARIGGKVQFSIGHLTVEERSVLAEYSQRVNAQQEELKRLREAVWSDGRPWVSTHYAESCKFCFARVPYGTSEPDQQQNYPHEPDCVWLAEDRRLKAES